MSELSGALALRCGRLLAVANAFLITTKHVDFSDEAIPKQITDEAIPKQITEQSSVTTQELVNNTE